MPNNNEPAEGDRHLSEEASRLASRGAAKGGRARAARLGPVARSESARAAAEARWGIQVATHDGELLIGDRKLDCAVLDDGTRVINQTTMQQALDRTGGARRGSGARGLPLLSALNLQKFITGELSALAASPITYRVRGGGRAMGYPAEILPMVCDVYLEARQEKALTKNQEPIARAAEILMRGLARVGIVALVDEATGYQEARARVELQAILAQYISSELQPWLKMFPDDFFREIYRLHNWEFKPGTSRRTPLVGKLIKHYIYEQLPPGVIEELERKNPRTEKGHRSYKHHQFLTADTGNPHLDKQISTVTTLMRISRSKQEFEDLFERAFPPLQPRLPLVIDVSYNDD